MACAAGRFRFRLLEQSLAIPGDRIWEEAPLAGTKVTLEEKGMQSIGFDPCGNRPDEGDSLSMMRANMQGLE
jgi:hypothetical protein